MHEIIPETGGIMYGEEFIGFFSWIFKVAEGESVTATLKGRKASSLVLVDIRWHHGSNTCQSVLARITPVMPLVCNSTF
jgi:hypothetical protein